MSNNVNTQILQDDEIDLRELWATLVKRKMSIFVVTLVTTVSAIFYAYTATPIYSGEITIEIGEVVINNSDTNNKPTVIKPLDNIGDLTAVLNEIYQQEDKKIKIEVPKGSSQLIQISYMDGDKSIIEKKLNQITTFVMNRQHEKELFYQKVNGEIHATLPIGKVNIGDKPIKPKKQLIVAVAFMSGLILGIFLAFFMEFISNGRQVDEKVEKHN